MKRTLLFLALVASLLGLSMKSATFAGDNSWHPWVEISRDGGSVDHNDGISAEELRKLWLTQTMKYRLVIQNGLSTPETYRAEWRFTTRSGREKVKTRVVTLSPEQKVNLDFKRGRGKLRDSTVKVFVAGVEKVSVVVRPVQGGWLEDSFRFVSSTPVDPPVTTYDEPGFIVVNRSSAPFKWASISATTFQSGAEQVFSFNQLIATGQAGQVLPPANGDWQLIVGRTDGKVAIPQDGGKSAKFHFDATQNQWVIELDDTDFHNP